MVVPVITNQVTAFHIHCAWRPLQHSHGQISNYYLISELLVLKLLPLVHASSMVKSVQPLSYLYSVLTLLRRQSEDIFLNSVIFQVLPSTPKLLHHLRWTLRLFSVLSVWFSFGKFMHYTLPSDLCFSSTPCSDCQLTILWSGHITIDIIALEHEDRTRSEIAPSFLHSSPCKSHQCRLDLSVFADHSRKWVLCGSYLLTALLSNCFQSHTRL